MLTKYVDTNIRVGIYAKRPTRNMVATAKRHNYNAVYPWRFRCSFCGQEWEGCEISVGVDLANVSCSNCYSDAVRLTQIKIEVCEANDFEEDEPA
jgi:transcription elongation factor Elf1